MSQELGLVVRPDTLLRCLRQAATIEVTAPRVIGVDDFAFSRGNRKGQLERQVNRLKLIKRMMYGRAKFDLLSDAVLRSTS